MNHDFELVITKHARQQMFDRGIDEDQIRKAITRGSKFKQTDGIKAVFGYVGVAYKVKGNKCIIKTVTME